jgi:1,4-dihydroxy-2-naphthoyl-CoA hydrolase
MIRLAARRSPARNLGEDMTEMPTPAQIRDTMPFAALVGVELLEATPQLVRGRMAFSPERCTAGGLMHGGALMALADSCGGVCAFLNLPEGAVATATIESKANFLRAVREGALTATTHPLHRGRTMMVIETEIARDDGALAAKVTQTQAFHYPRS